MGIVADNLKELLVQTIQRPREGAQRVLALPASSGQVWAAFVATILASVVLMGLNQLLFPVPADDPSMIMFQMTPFMATIVIGGLTLALTSAVVAIGKMFGGAGTMNGALRLIAWLQAILIVLQIVQFVLLIVLPPLALLISLASIGLFFWLLFAFVAELHKFPSLGPAVMVTILAFVATSFVLISLISNLGLIPVSELPNV